MFRSHFCSIHTRAGNGSYFYGFTAAGEIVAEVPHEKTRLTLSRVKRNSQLAHFKIKAWKQAPSLTLKGAFLGEDNCLYKWTVSSRKVSGSRNIFRCSRKVRKLVSASHSQTGFGLS